MKKEPEAKGNNKVSPNKDIQQDGASAYNRKGSRHAANKIEEKKCREMATMEQEKYWQKHHQ